MKFFLNKYRLLSLIAVIAATLTFTACDSNNGTGTLKVSLTDAPANYEEVNIEIRQVLVNQNENAEEPDENGEEENGWHAIMEDSITVNLLDYQNGGVLALGETELETGRYNQIRLLLGENNNVVIDGETYALTTPSAQQTGYKLNVQADIEEGQVYDLVIDFDASQSIVVTGNGNFILKPVLRTVNLEQQASIAGTVLPLEAEPYVYAIIGEDTLGTQTDDEGDFKLTGLDEGTYDVWFNPTNDNYADSLVEGINLETGENFEFEEAIELESEGLLD